MASAGDRRVGLSETPYVVSRKIREGVMTRLQFLPGIRHVTAPWTVGEQVFVEVEIVMAVQGDTFCDAGANEVVAGATAV